MFNFIKKHFKKDLPFTVTQFGRILDPNKYTWDEKTKTFTTNEDCLDLDFSGMVGVGVIFKTGSYCTFKTNSNCMFKTRSNCTFETGHNCMFNTGDFCVFKTGSNCMFKTGSFCVFNTKSFCTFVTDMLCEFSVGINCIFTAGAGSVLSVGGISSLSHTWYNGFKIFALESNKNYLVLDNGEVKEVLGAILTNPYTISWWKENQEIMIKVGCQTHSLDFWKKDYEQIAKKDEFDENLIPEYLGHLKTIEESLLCLTL